MPDTNSELEGFFSGLTLNSTFYIKQIKLLSFFCIEFKAFLPIINFNDVIVFCDQGKNFEAKCI